MANIKSQIKRNKTNEKKNLANSSKKAACHTYVRKVEEAVKAGNKEEALKALPAAFKHLDKLAGDKIISKNNAARHKSNLQLLVNGLK